MKENNYYEQIWDAVRRIPKGKVSTYGQIARIAGLGENARMAGYALYNIPDGMDIPWHRVINAQGKISLPKLGGHYERQKKKLLADGIRFVGEKIDLKIYEWVPED